MPHTLVVTVTPNPSLDLLFAADRLVWDDANRMDDPRRRPGGQGVNVARAVRVLGAQALAVAMLAGRTGDEILAALQHEGTAVRSVPAGGETRTFVAVTDAAAGHSMLLNARGPARTAADEAALEHAVEEELRALAPRWLACCGSLPPGMSADTYARLARLARTAGARVVVDCDGDALRHAAPHCDLLVPNRHEAGRLLGRDIGGLEEAIRALADLPAPTAAITLGPDGAVLRHDGRTWHGRAHIEHARSTVGAGDCFLAGLLVGLDRSGEGGHALRCAIAAGSAALLSAGPDLLTPADLRAVEERVVVERVA
jgi:1-phosphofructokinase